MTIVTAQHCVSLDPFYDRLIPSDSKPDQFYMVRINYPGDLPDDWICTCPSFTYRGRCKHIDKMAEYKLCHWHELTGPEKQTDDEARGHICPRCGNMTTEALEDDGKQED